MSISSIFKSAMLLGARAVGVVARVEHVKDKYRDYHATAFELVDDRRLKPHVALLLEQDPVFQGEEKIYLLTAVQCEKKGQLKQRQFYVTAAHVEQLDLDPHNPQGDKTQLLNTKKFTATTFGQFLDFEPSVRPRIVALDVQDAPLSEISAVWAKLKTSRPKTKMELRYQSLER